MGLFTFMSGSQFLDLFEGEIELITAICKSQNGESGNGMRLMMGTQGIRMGTLGIRVRTWVIRVGTRGIKVGMREIRVRMRGMGVGVQGIQEMWGIRVEMRESG